MRNGLEDIVDIHQMRSAEAVRGWTRPIDLLLLDGDQSPQGARAAFEAWEPFLKPGGIIILRNTKDRAYAEGHDGHRRLAVEALVPPRFVDKRQVNATTLAVKA
jgi:predicted O-methyltransferase YrrM